MAIGTPPLIQSRSRVTSASARCGRRAPGGSGSISPVVATVDALVREAVFIPAMLIRSRLDGPSPSAGKFEVTAILEKLLAVAWLIELVRASLEQSWPRCHNANRDHAMTTDKTPDIRAESPAARAEIIGPSASVQLPAVVPRMPSGPAPQRWFRRAVLPLMLLTAAAAAGYWWLHSGSGLPPGIAWGQWPARGRRDRHRHQVCGAHFDALCR